MSNKKWAESGSICLIDRLDNAPASGRLWPLRECGEMISGATRTHRERERQKAAQSLAAVDD